MRGKRIVNPLPISPSWISPLGGEGEGGWTLGRFRGVGEAKCSLSPFETDGFREKTSFRSRIKNSCFPIESLRATGICGSVPRSRRDAAFAARARAGRTAPRAIYFQNSFSMDREEEDGEEEERKKKKMNNKLSRVASSRAPNYTAHAK